MNVPMCPPYSSNIARHERQVAQRRALSWFAAAVFFLEVFGLASLAMGGALVLATAPRIHEAVVPAISDVAPAYNDTYLEAFANGPGRGWYVLGPRAEKSVER